jgi:hypothetical protein
MVSDDGAPCAALALTRNVVGTLPIAFQTSSRTQPLLKA